MSHNYDSVQNTLLCIALSYFSFLVRYNILFAELLWNIYGIAGQNLSKKISILLQASVFRDDEFVIVDYFQNLVSLISLLGVIL